MNLIKSFSFFLLCTSITSHAALISSASDPVLANGTTITFNDLALGSYTSITSSDVTFFNDDIVRTPPVQGISITDRRDPTSSPYSSNVLKYSTSVFPEPEGLDQPSALLRFDFIGPVRAFGFDLIESSYPIYLTAFNRNGTLIETFEPISGFVRNEYRGIAASEDISYAILGNYQGYDYIIIDNFTVVTSAVPIPAALPLMVSGLAMLGIGMRKRSEIATIA